MFPLDIRQSPEWLLYLEFLGWEKIETSNGVRAALMDNKLGKAIKVQRPEKVVSSDLEEIEKVALERKISMIKVEPSLNQDLKILEDAGFIPQGSPLSPPTTIFIDLTLNPEDLWAQLSDSCRYSIRRAQREGAKTEFFTNPSKEKVAEFYKIHASTGKQKSFYIQGEDEIQKKVELFGDKAILGIVSTKEGAATGANLYLGYGKGIWFIHGGTTAEGRKTKNGYELYWQSFLYFKSLGYAWLDLEGVDDRRYPAFTKNWGGLSHFKERFGGTRVEFPSPYVKLFNPWLRKLSKYVNLQI